jgi:hypothetical protein
MTSLKNYEAKAWSQHGEDGIIRYLTGKLDNPTKTYVEIGAAWAECNSRALIEQGWTGVVYDIGDVQRFPHAISKKITHKNVTVDIPEPDFFSLDIDSYDYFIADAMLRRGFQPRVVCVETNTFIPGTLTVPFIDPFSRYKLQPGIGLYFGCSLDAWKHLWGKYGYIYVGMDSSFTNAFFVQEGEESDDFGYQEYFCRKYRMNGEQLRETLSEKKFLDVTTQEYEAAFES